MRHCRLHRCPGNRVVCGEDVILLRVLVVITFRSYPAVSFPTEVLHWDLGPFENRGRPFALLVFASCKIESHLHPRGNRSIFFLNPTAVFKLMLSCCSVYGALGTSSLNPSPNALLFGHSRLCQEIRSVVSLPPARSESSLVSHLPCSVLTRVSNAVHHPSDNISRTLPFTTLPYSVFRWYSILTSSSKPCFSQKLYRGQIDAGSLLDHRENLDPSTLSSRITSD